MTRESKLQLNLLQEKEQLKAFYEHLKEVTAKIDTTLSQHSQALQKRALEKVEALEKKMLRAEKRKFEAHQRQIGKLREQLFPGESLQERQENFSTFYGKYGKELFTRLFDASVDLEYQFGILTLK